MTTITTTWTSGGETMALVTPREDGETATQHADRHLDKLKSMLDQYPPD